MRAKFTFNNIKTCIITRGSLRGWVEALSNAKGKRRGDLIKYRWVMRLLHLNCND
jgi:hypothetical protein